MTERIVIDTNALIVSLLDESALNSEELVQRPRASVYMEGLESGEYVAHLPMLVAVEIAAAISRRTKTDRLALLARVKKSLIEWERNGQIVLYELDRNRMDGAVHVAEQYRLRGADAVVAALAEELDASLKTFDKDILKRFSRASS